MRVFVSFHVCEQYANMYLQREESMKVLKELGWTYVVVSTILFNTILIHDLIAKVTGSSIYWLNWN